MATLLIDRKDVELRHEGGRLLIYESGRRSGSIPVAQLDRVVIQNRTLIDSGVLGLLAEQGVGLVVLTPRRTARIAHLPGRGHNDVARRIGQYRRFCDPLWRARWSRMLVRHKLRAQRRLLSHALERRPDQRRVLKQATGSLEQRLHSLSGMSEPDRQTLMGVEGAAAVAYFKGLAALFPSSLGFVGRNRRPPRDPVNACLSLGYTLIHTEAIFQLHGAGLDPLLGFYHDPSFGRDSLASDLIEPLRPWIDDRVWWLFRQRRLTVDHFFRDGEACLLNKAGRKVFFQTWASGVDVPQRLLRRWARRLARTLSEPPGDGGERCPR